MMNLEKSRRKTLTPQETTPINQSRYNTRRSVFLSTPIARPDTPIVLSRAKTPTGKL